MYSSLAFKRTNNRNNAPSPLNNSNCYSRGPCSRITSLRELLHYWRKENNRTNNRNNAPSPQNNSNCNTRGPVEFQAYEGCYTTNPIGNSQVTKWFIINYQTYYFLEGPSFLTKGGHTLTKQDYDHAFDSCGEFFHLFYVAIVTIVLFVTMTLI